MSSASNVNLSHRRRSWQWLFPVLWWAFLAVTWAAIHFLGQRWMESDERAMATIVIANLAWLVPTVWALFFWPRFRQLGRTRRWSIRLAVLAFIVAGFLSIDVDYDGDGRWRSVRFRWATAPDERLDQLNAEGVAGDWLASPDDYPRFLGNGYWAEAPDATIAGNWQEAAPQLVWKRKIGAGWSGSAVVGNYAVTQEQRGKQELVTCYRLSDGHVVWTHADRTRHDPSDTGGGMGGVGPRATPTVADGRVYSMGATGIVNCLDALSGKRLWSHRLQEEFNIEPLLWGNSGSPLVVPDSNLVVVNAGQAVDPDGHSLLALDRDTGKVVWRAGPATTSYASPLHAVLAGVPQIVQVNESTIGGYRASDGHELWLIDQPGSSSANASCSQAIPLPGDQVLASKGYGIGARLIQLAQGTPDRLDAELVWKSRRVLRTKLANLVIRDGYAYGLDHTMMSCVDIATGKLQWKKRRERSIGHGQVMLAGDKLFVLSETGEAILLRCTPEQYVELASMQMLTDEGITWNNPAIAGDYLLVRNNLEAACYRLPSVNEPSE